METGIIDVPVVIIGGGGVGLTLSCFLSDYNVKHVFFEKHPSTSILSKAHYLNQRTLETFRQHGMWDAVTAKSAPLHDMSRVEWRTTLGEMVPSIADSSAPCILLVEVPTSTLLKLTSECDTWKYDGSKIRYSCSLTDRINPDETVLSQRQIFLY